MTLLVRLGPVDFLSAIPLGDGFTIESFEGWNDGTESRLTEIPRPQAHGAFDLPVFAEPRVITIEGYCRADSIEKLGWYQSLFTGLLANGDSKRIVVTEFGRTLWVDVRRASRPRFTPWGGQKFADFSISAWAANPRKFGESRTFAGGVAAYHFGNFAASPIHTVSGTGSGYTINGPGGKTFTVTQAVTDGNPHTIDMATGFLEVGGVVVTGQVTSADTWAIPGGGTVTHTLTGSGLTLSTAVLDTYI